MSRVEDILEADELYQDVTDETDMARWAQELLAQKMWPRRNSFRKDK